MRVLEKAEEGRMLHGPYASQRGDLFGAFRVMGPKGEQLVILASDGVIPGDPLAGWEHVSVSTKRRIPNWQEMCWVKDLFWAEEECVVQYHPPKSSYVNNHPHVLHLWRPVDGKFPMPPPILVGVKEVGEIKTDAQLALAKQMMRDGIL